MAKKYEVIIVGAGHNSLVCGAKLVKEAGIKNILVLEKASMLGGCSRTDPNKLPGYKLDTGAQCLHAATGEVASALGLREFGLEPLELVPNCRWLLGGDRKIDVYPDLDATIKEIERYSKEEASNYRRLANDCAPYMAQVMPLMSRPDITFSQLMQVLESVGRDAVYMYLCRASDLLRAYFDSDWVMGGIARTILANSMDPRWPATGWMVPYVFASNHSGRPYWRAKGGMEGFVGSIARLIEHYGGEVRLNTGVQKIIIEDGQAKGVRLESGEEIEGDIIISGTHFKVSYFDLVGEKNLESRFVAYLKRIVESYSGFGVFLALDEEPETGGSVFQLLVGGLRNIEDGFEALSKNRPPEHPSLWIHNPCIVDPTVAPPGKYWVSMFALVSRKLEGTTWEAEKERYAERCVDMVNRHIPNLKRHIIGRYIQTPDNIEGDMNLPGATALGPVMSLEQMWSMRAPIRSPIKNLYMTGMGVHPGGGVTGRPGLNTATVIIQDLGSEKMKKKKG